MLRALPISHEANSGPLADDQRLAAWGKPRPFSVSGPELVNRWVNQDSGRVVNIWWSHKDRATRLLALILLCTSQPDFPEEGAGRLLNHSDTPEEDARRGEEISFVIKHREVLAKALREFYRKKFGARFEPFNAEALAILEKRLADNQTSDLLTLPFSKALKKRPPNE